MAETRMNLAALQQRDPYITDIVETASQVALYSFSSKVNEWEKTSIEGSLFVYKRSANPLFGFMILNRLGLNNLIEPITKDLEFQVQDPFLLYRNAKNIYGIWFYEKDECSCIGKRMNSLLDEIAGSRKRTPHHVDVVEQVEQVEQVEPVKTDLSCFGGSMGQVDIMKMLTKAQSEYDMMKSVPMVTSKSEAPRPMTDHLNTESKTDGSSLVRPTPVKYISTSPVFTIDTSQPPPPLNLPVKSGDSAKAPMTLEALFRKASQSHHQGGMGGMGDVITTELPDVTKPSILQRSVSLVETESKNRDLHPMLQQLITSGPTVAEIERQLTDHTERTKSQGDTGHSSASQENLMKFTPPSQKLHHVASVPKSLEGVCDSLQSMGSAMLAGLAQISAGSKSDLSESLLKPGDIENVTLSQSATNLPTRTVLVEKSKSLEEMLLPTSAACPDVLLSPMTFTKKKTSPVVNTLAATSVSLDRSHSDSSDTDISSSQPAPLTRDQLQQAMMYLIKNDINFVTCIHEAYLKSFHAATTFKS